MHRGRRGLLYRRNTVGIAVVLAAALLVVSHQNHLGKTVVDAFSTSVPRDPTRRYRRSTLERGKQSPFQTQLKRTTIKSKGSRNVLRATNNNSDGERSSMAKKNGKRNKGDKRVVVKRVKKRKKIKQTSSLEGDPLPVLDDVARKAKETKDKLELVRAVGQEIKERTSLQQQQAADAEVQTSNRLLDRVNPFKAGQSLRQTIGTALTTLRQPEPITQSRYYLDEFDAPVATSSSMASSDDTTAFIPEVLVVGATGALGRHVVQLLTRDPRFRVRVLVRDLYTQTLEALGPSVTYCPGDLTNVDSLDYAVTDVDKIVFCAHGNAQRYARNTNDVETTEEIRQRRKRAMEAKTLDRNFDKKCNNDSGSDGEAPWAEQVDVIGMENLVRAYQNVRHADFGTSQAVKRSLFKFQDRPEDFTLFSLDVNDDTQSLDVLQKTSATVASDKEEIGLPHCTSGVNDENEYFDEYGDTEYNYDEYEYEVYSDYDDMIPNDTDVLEKRNDVAVQSQSQWIRNQFEHGVFVGRIPKTPVVDLQSAEAAIISSRLRSRQDPDMGIELGPGFAGFICRVCSDGGTYEAFVRTGAYVTEGIEYVCEFSTSTKRRIDSNKSRNKFATIRLAFDNFTPVVKKDISATSTTDVASIPPFNGLDVRHIGFRYRSSANADSVTTDRKGTAWYRFYLALSYIKLYRSQPEPEFIYISDARIPPVVRSNMVLHESRQLLKTDFDGSMLLRGIDQVKLLDDTSPTTGDGKGDGRCPQETYYKYRGEEILKQSGVAYAIVRVSEFDEGPFSPSLSAIELSPEPLSHEDKDPITQVQREEVAKLCVGALLDPKALNKSFYVHKGSGTRPNSKSELSSKFAALPVDKTP